MNELREMASRIKELREISGFTVEQMAEKTEVSVEEYTVLEQGVKDFGFTFIYKCAAAFGFFGRTTDEELLKKRAEDFYAGA